MRRHRPRALRTDGATFRFASAGWTRRPAPSTPPSSPAVGAAAGGFACTRASGESGSVGASAPAPGTGAGPLGAPRPRPRGSAREPGPGGASLGGRFGRGWWVAGRRRGLGRAGERRHRKSGRAALGGDTALFRVASSWRARGPAPSARLLRRSLEVRGERWRGRWLEDRLEASRRTVALEAEGDGGDRPPADPFAEPAERPAAGSRRGRAGHLARCVGPADDDSRKARARGPGGDAAVVGFGSPRGVPEPAAPGRSSRGRVEDGWRRMLRSGRRRSGRSERVVRELRIGEESLAARARATPRAVSGGGGARANGAGTGSVVGAPARYRVDRRRRSARDAGLGTGLADRTRRPRRGRDGRAAALPRSVGSADHRLGPDRRECDTDEPLRAGLGFRRRERSRRPAEVAQRSGGGVGGRLAGVVRGGAGRLRFSRSRAPGTEGASGAVAAEPVRCDPGVGTVARGPRAAFGDVAQRSAASDRGRCREARERGAGLLPEVDRGALAAEPVGRPPALGTRPQRGARRFRPAERWTSTARSPDKARRGRPPRAPGRRPEPEHRCRGIASRATRGARSNGGRHRSLRAPATSAPCPHRSCRFARSSGSTGATDRSGSSGGSETMVRAGLGRGSRPCRRAHPELAMADRADRSRRRPPGDRAVPRGATGSQTATRGRRRAAVRAARSGFAGRP